MPSKHKALEVKLQDGQKKKKKKRKSHVMT
jgi:hypothetical protein